MKKKIKNLTLKQVKQLCESHFELTEDGGNCDTCPYAGKFVTHCKLDYVHLDEYGEETVEVKKELRKYEDKEN